MFDKEELKFNVNLSGEHYINYLIYRDSKRKKSNKNLKLFFKSGMPYFIVAIALLILWFSIKSILYVPEPTEPLGYTEVFGYSISNGILGFLLIAMGLAWICHGFGFILVRR